MSAVDECDECKPLFEAIEEATLSYFKILSQLGIARFLHDQAAIERIAAELQEAATLKSRLATAMRQHRAQMHAGVTPAVSVAGKHVCDFSCECKMNLEAAANALEQSSALLSASIFSGSDSLIEKYHALVRDTTAKLTLARTTYAVHLAEGSME